MSVSWNDLVMFVQKIIFVHYIRLCFVECTVVPAF